MLRLSVILVNITEHNTELYLLDFRNSSIGSEDNEDDLVLSSKYREEARESETECDRLCKSQ